MKTLKILLIAIIFISISSCAARVLGVLAAEEVAAIRLLGVRATATELVIESEAALAARLPRVRLLRTPGARSKLYIRQNGKNTVYADLLNQSTIKWSKSGAVHNIPGSFYTVKNGSAVRLRTGPGKTYPVYATANPNRVVILLEENQGWSKIRLSDKVSGWVESAFLLAAAPYSNNEELTNVANYSYSNETTYKTIACQKCNGHAGKNCTNCSGAGNNRCSECRGSGTKSCTNCRNAGQLTCRSCRGSGNYVCNICRGSSSLTCRTCRGSGYRGSINGTPLTCVTCRGAGSYTCRNGCTGGYFICQDCRGAGNNICTYCKGAGQHICQSCKGVGQLTCLYCNGSGRYTCSECSNEGLFRFTVAQKPRNKQTCSDLQSGDFYYFNNSREARYITIGALQINGIYQHSAIPILVLPKRGICLYNQKAGPYQYRIWTKDNPQQVEVSPFDIFVCQTAEFVTYMNINPQIANITTERQGF